jgi:hypothetical protein
MSTAANMRLPPGTDLSRIPSAKAPAGVASNLINPESNGDGIVAVNATFMIVAFVFVFSRLWMKLSKKEKFGWDDFMVAFGLVLAYVFSSLNFYSK